MTKKKNNRQKSRATTKKPTNQQIDNLDMWDWSTLVASWRYFEYRCTIASSSFPREIIERYWRSGNYTNNALDTIANQFANIDHGSRGEEDWTKTWGDTIHDCDKKSWCKFYAFCKAWCDGFTTLTIDNKRDPVADCECFYCNYTKHWHPKKEYISNPYVDYYCPDEYIKGFLS